MSTKDIWFGMLEAGEKSSPVVRDGTLDASPNKVWLYNHVRDQFIEYAKAIVEPKLRDLKDDDVNRDELDKAFKSARLAFSSTRKAQTWADTKPAPPRAKDNDDDEPDYDIDDDDEMEEFIDDDD